MTDKLLRDLGEGAAVTRRFVGADRIDYTKGIPERLMGFDLMLKRHPELRTKVTLLQLSAPSRIHVKEYRDLNELTIWWMKSTGGIRRKIGTRFISCERTTTTMPYWPATAWRTSSWSPPCTTA